MASVNLDYYRPSLAPTHDDDRIRCAGSDGILEIRGGKIYLMNSKGNQVFEKFEAPELFSEFLDGHDPISTEEIFYLTKVALLARESADEKKEIRIEGEL